MNSTQLHYREATRALEAAHTASCTVRLPEPAVPLELPALLEAVTHALLACTAALAELSRQADPQLEAVATSLGVLRPVSDIRHHAHNAFGSDR